ncbi:GPN-loop GTPase 3 [Astathelohania contejeani]|uniref:GPN-loop GTPase 3 n=1 Tax=Astathelohania contejeani TaxID=164912 RepID=A0ABQ7HY91_9MICR|nr:GPN-loop GTPase 3 [Thelohania contejeani]
MGYAIFVLGPAGSGKTTFCTNLKEHGKAIHRPFHLINLDPAQQDSSIDYDLSITDYITVTEVMEMLDYGPNGGLVVALEELYENIEELELETYTGDYLIIDCPGQIELFTHSEVITNIVKYMQQYFTCAAVFLMEASYMTDTHKYISGCLCATLCMARFGLPHVNIMSKMDLIERQSLPNEVNLNGKDKYSGLTRKILEFVNENNMVEFQPLNWNDEETVEDILYSIDSVLQYFDDLEPKEED